MRETISISLPAEIRTCLSLKKDKDIVILYPAGLWEHEART